MRERTGWSRSSRGTRGLGNKGTDKPSAISPQRSVSGFDCCYSPQRNSFLLLLLLLSSLIPAEIMSNLRFHARKILRDAGRCVQDAYIYFWGSCIFLRASVFEFSKRFVKGVREEG